MKTIYRVWTESDLDGNLTAYRDFTDHQKAAEFASRRGLMTETFQQDEKIATFVQQVTDDVNPNFVGSAKIWRMEPPLNGHGLVVTSASSAFGHSETYIFGWNPETRRPIMNRELPGSTQGTLDHAEAIHNAGYTIQY